MITPDSITLGGLGVGVLFSTLVPALQQERTWHGGLLSSLIGAAVGFFLLWGIVMLGKMMFGQIKHEFDEPVDFEISQPGGEEEAIVIQLGPEHQYEWQDVFYRKSDRMNMEVSEVYFNDKARKVKESFKIVGDGFVIDGEKTDLEGVKKVSGKCTSAVVPREAMGFGDVKFIAMIGAFQGWQAVLITVMAACCIGAVIGSIQKILSKESKIPFGPYLALGAFIFVFTGAAIWNWYSGIWHGAFR
jgi:leader peptidase (prepilin peptidase)/N-methyltransferase